MSALINYEFVIDESSIESFDVENSIEIAMDNIDSYIQKINVSYYEGFSYKDNVWYVYTESVDTISEIDYSLYNQYKNKNMLDILKCWFSSLLLDYAGTTISAHFRYLINILNITTTFSGEKLSDLEQYLSELPIPKKNRMINSILNFFDFYDELETTDEYIQLVSELREKEELTPREIPSSRDCMMFLLVLKDFFKNTPFSEEKHLYFKPIWIWWVLTTKVPMRIGEFLKIKRNALINKRDENDNDTFLLLLPRSKEKNNKRRIQIIDEIEINQSLHDIIKDYIKKTDKYGESDTLISYKAHRKLRASIHGYNDQKFLKKRNDKRINLDSFQKVLTDFYDLVIKCSPYDFTLREAGNDDLSTISMSRKQGVQYDIERRLRPNDTRHLAFMFLKLQGLHPIEIARLGGHSTLGSQRHYFQHREFETDSSTIQLLRLFDLDGMYFKSKFFKSIEEPTVNSKIDNEFRRRYILKIREPNKEKWDKLEFGWCTINPKRCKTHCFQCEYWKIENDEYQQKYNKIIKWINATENKAEKIYNSLSKLHEIILSNKETEFELNWDIKQELNSKSKKLKDLLKSIGVCFDTIQNQIGVNMEWETSIQQRKSKNFLIDM